LSIIDSYPLASTDITWDGSHLWSLYSGDLIKLNEVVQPICKIEWLSGGPIYGWKKVEWDGQFLWVLNTDAGNKIFRMDPSACR